MSRRFRFKTVVNIVVKQTTLLDSYLVRQINPTGQRVPVPVGQKVDSYPNARAQNAPQQLERENVRQKLPASEIALKFGPKTEIVSRTHMLLFGASPHTQHGRTDGKIKCY